jgi:G protein beta subunit-like protein
LDPEYGPAKAAAEEKAANPKADGEADKGENGTETPTEDAKSSDFSRVSSSTARSVEAWAYDVSREAPGPSAVPDLANPEDRARLVASASSGKAPAAPVSFPVHPEGPPVDPNTGAPYLEATLATHQRWVWDCAFSADSAYLVTVCSDHYARLWELATGQIIRQYSGHHRGAVCVALNDYSEPR